MRGEHSRHYNTKAAISIGIAPSAFISLSMNQISVDVFSLAEKRLNWVGQRQSVLAQNIANANTPGYAAKDVSSFSEYLNAQARQTAAGGAGQTTAAALVKTVEAKSLNGNGIVMDEQLEKVAETDTAHQLAANLYKKYVSLFKTALGRG